MNEKLRDMINRKWNDRSAFVVILEIKNDDELIVQSYNSTFGLIVQKGPRKHFENVRTKELREVISDINSNYIYDIVKIFKNAYNNVNYLQETDYPLPNSFWDTRIIFDGDNAVFIGKLLNDTDHVLNKLKDMNELANAMLEEVDDGFKVTSISDSEIFHDSPLFKVGNVIKNEPSEVYGHSRLMNMIKKAVRLKMPLKYMHLSITFMKPCQISIMPLFQMNKTIIFVSIRMLEPNKSLGTYDEFHLNISADRYHNQIMAVCNFEFIDTSPVMFDSNSTFFKFFTDYDIQNAIDIISESHGFKAACESKTITKETIDICGVDYICVFMPLTHKAKNTMQNLYVCIVKTDERINQLALQKLTAREMEVAKLITKGYFNKEIASKLNICEGTVKKTVYNIFIKMDANSRSDFMQKLDNFTLDNQ